MASVSSNRAEVTRNLLYLANACRFHMPAPSGATVGESLVSTTVEAIKHQTIDEQRDPTGSPLKPLSARYLAWKARMGYPATIGIREHEMLADAAIKGTVRINSEGTELVMDYGDSDVVKERAQYFLDGGRTFFGVSEDGEKQVEALFDGILRAACQSGPVGATIH